MTDNEYKSKVLNYLETVELAKQKFDPIQGIDSRDLSILYLSREIAGIKLEFEAFKRLHLGDDDGI